jgi:hypothetical protein
MEVNDQNMAQVQALMLQALSSDNVARRQGKQFLRFFYFLFFIAVFIPCTAYKPSYCYCDMICAHTCSGGDDHVP